MQKPKTVHSPESALLCRWLNEKRKERDLSMQEVADRLGWSKAVVGKIFVGDRRLDVVEYVALCAALEIDGCAGLRVIKKGSL